MPITLLDLPSDIFRSEILPCLDYESRINFNRLLLPEERLTYPIPYQSIVRHIMRIRKGLFTSTQRKFIAAVGTEHHIGAWRDYCRSLLRNPMVNLVQYYSRERSVIESWLTYFERHAEDRRRCISEELFQDIHDFTKRIREHFEHGWANPTLIEGPRTYRVNDWLDWV